MIPDRADTKHIALSAYIIALAARIAAHAYTDLSEKYPTDASYQRWLKAFYHAFSIPESEQANVKNFFYSAIGDTAPIHHYANLILRIHNHPEIRQSIIARLVAFTCDHMPPNELQVQALKDIATYLDVAPDYIQPLLDKRLKPSHAE